MMWRGGNRLSRWLRPARTPKQRSLSDQVLQTLFVRQGGLLECDVTGLARCNVNIASKWQDHCEISYSDDSSFNIEVSENQPENHVRLTLSEATAGAGGVLNITVPEYLDISLNANHINLVMTGKVQGDMNIMCTAGTVTVDKVRGEVLHFICGDADLTVKKLMEGNSVIQCRALQGKMINGDEIDISAAHVAVDAVYGARTNIEASDDITVGLCRGMIEAVSWKGNVSVSNIDGAFDVRAEHGSIKLQVNKLLPFTDAPQGGLNQPTQAHNSSSSSGGSGGAHAGLQSVEHAHRGKGSRATAVKGHITAVVDPELAATIHCRSDSGGLQRMCATINSDAFQLEPYGTRDSYEYEMDVRTPRVGTWEGTCIRGLLTGKSTGVKRPTFSKGNTRSGKIDLAGAEAQALEAGGVSLKDAREEVSGGTADVIIAESDAPGSDGSESSTARDNSAASSSAVGDGEYDLTLVARGNVRVETMSWIQIIRSKYGFEDTVGGGSSRGTLPPSKVGRTASATSEAAEIARLALGEDNK